MFEPGELGVVYKQKTVESSIPDTSKSIDMESEQKMPVAAKISDSPDKNVSQNIINHYITFSRGGM